MAPSKHLVSVEVASREKPQKTLGWFVRSTDITCAVPVVRLKAMGRLPMLLVLGSVFLPSQTRCDRA